MSDRNPQDDRSFLNVDLEIYSAQPLDVLAAALGDAVHVLFLGKRGRRQLLSVELRGSGVQRTADPIIRNFVRLIEALPPHARYLWDSAAECRFDVGMQASPSGSTTLVLQPATVHAVSAVRAAIVVTIYPPRR